VTERALHVLVVDDSAVMRQILVGLLNGPGMQVTATPDAVTALERIRLRRPDVIVLDLEMPRMDGLTFLRRIMADDPIPVVVCSTSIGESGRAAMEALAAGAVDVVGKPRVGLREFLENTREDLVARLRGAATSRPKKRGVSVRPPPPHPKPVQRKPPVGDRRYVVAIGASTGGPEALHQVLRELPAASPALVVVQHMPEGFTRAFAAHLHRSTSLEVKEAEPGDPVVPGRALIARAGQHLQVIQGREGLEVILDGGPPVNHVRPSVDVLFSSVARTCGKHAIGIVLTGMGADGALGLLEMRRAGARTVAQDEASSVVFGMPKVAVARGGAAEVAPLTDIASAILRGPSRG
jgi:two-component system, chemotaxis family, protein-glutamate methylesterase/glutaminase